MLNLISRTEPPRVLSLIWEPRGLVSVRRDGRHQYYRARRDQLGSIVRYLETL